MIVPVSVSGRVDGVRDPEVGDLDRPVTPLDQVPGLQVAVDEPLRVRMLEPGGDLSGDPPHLLGGQRALTAQPLVERSAPPRAPSR